MAPLRVLQVSDLHAGTREEPEVENDLRALVAELEPELVVVSGDLTHRNTAEQHERAAALLSSLGAPLLVIPGNHDIPRWPPWRMTHTFDEFLRVWPHTEPVYRSERMVVCGLNSVRPWKQQGGALRGSQLARVREVLAEAPPGALRMVALHHHLLGAPWRTVKRTIANRSSVLGALVDAGAELIVSGHVHQSAISQRHEFEVVEGAVHGTTVVTAPGLGQPRPRRRGEARGLHLFEVEDRSLTAVTFSWTGSDWCRIAERRFPRGSGGLA
ncbi:MAG TPA: metallophosphoesterase [Gaiellaceae bacterium]|jgi:3',5'-cyclic AMP phosphodiesterase CpdA